MISRANSSSAALLSVYSGQTCIGFVLSRGGKGYESLLTPASVRLAYSPIRPPLPPPSRRHDRRHHADVVGLCRRAMRRVRAEPCKAGYEAFGPDGRSRGIFQTLQQAADTILPPAYRSEAA
jgi:hypothetical protein